MSANRDLCRGIFNYIFSLAVYVFLMSFGSLNAAVFNSESLDYQQSFNLTAQQNNVHNFTVPAEHNGWRLVLAANQSLYIELKNVTTDQQVTLIQTNTNTWFFAPEQLVAGEQFELSVQNRIRNSTATYTLASEMTQKTAVNLFILIPLTFLIVRLREATPPRGTVA